MKTQTSFHIDGFWFHLTLENGRATDQHGGVWNFANETFVSECGTFESKVATPAPIAAPRATGKPAYIYVSLLIQSMAANYVTLNSRHYPYTQKQHRLTFVTPGAKQNPKLAQICAN